MFDAEGKGSESTYVGFFRTEGVYLFLSRYKHVILIFEKTELRTLYFEGKDIKTHLSLTNMGLLCYYS